MIRRVYSLFGGTIRPNPARRGLKLTREIDTRLAAPGQIVVRAVDHQAAPLHSVDVMRAATNNPAESMARGVEQVLASVGWP